MSPRPRGVEEIDAALESLAIVTSLADKLAYQPLSDLDADILWNTSVHDMQPLIVPLTGLLQSL